MSDYERRIAKVESATFGYEDHGILTCWLHVSYGDGGYQGIGGYALDEYDPEVDRRKGTAYGCEFIVRLMRACGVDEWSKLKGRTIFAICDPSERAGFGRKVVGVAPLPTEDGEEFLFDDLRVEFFAEAA